MPALGLPLASVVYGLFLAAAAAAGSPSPSISSAGIVNAATGQGALAPYTICTIYGTNLFLNGSATASGSSQLPNNLAGVAVLISANFAGIVYISADQINLLIPNSLTPGVYSITVMRDGLASETVPLVLQEVAPGLFPSAPGVTAAFHADGSTVSAASPAVPGEVVVMYATGLGRLLPDPQGRSIVTSAAPIAHAADFSVLLDGVAIDPLLVQYVGATPGNAGLYQVNVRLPDNLSGTNPEVQVSLAGVTSPGGLRLITAAAAP
jgi:uncharacterized protein (TIGR03437 family)